MKPRLLLLGRPDCGLCEEFEVALWSHIGADRLELTHADVDSRADWQRRYGLKIPVLLTEAGEPLCSVHFDAVALDGFLKG